VKPGETLLQSHGITGGCRQYVVGKRTQRGVVKVETTCIKAHRGVARPGADAPARPSHVAQPGADAPARLRHPWV